MKLKTLTCLAMISSAAFAGSPYFGGSVPMRANASATPSSNYYLAADDFAFQAIERSVGKNAIKFFSNVNGECPPCDAFRDQILIPWHANNSDRIVIEIVGPTSPKTMRRFSVPRYPTIVGPGGSKHTSISGGDLRQVANTSSAGLVTAVQFSQVMPPPSYSPPGVRYSPPRVSTPRPVEFHGTRVSSGTVFRAPTNYSMPSRQCTGNS